MSDVMPQRRRVLLVDDEAQVRSFVKAFLLAANFDVTEANDGIEALAIIHEAASSFDLLITDIKMPRMDGITLARSLAGSFPALPVLFISGYVSEPDHPHEPGGPKWEFLQKPFLPKTLIQKITSLLGDDPKR